MTDRSHIKRGMFLKGANCPGAVMTKAAPPGERKADADAQILARLEQRNAEIARDFEMARLTLAARKWRRLHSL